MKKVVTLLVENLLKLGVTHAFGIPGRPVAAINAEIGKQGLRYVLCRHESGAGFAAAGYALMNDSLGVVVGTGGPGGTNLLTAAGQAKAYNLPVLFITGHPSMQETGKSLGHDASFLGTDLVKMFEPVTLFSAQVGRAETFPLYLKHALEKACSGMVKGPVHLNIPADVLSEEIKAFDVDILPSPILTSNAIEQIIPLLNEARSPVLFLGKGVHLSQAYEEVQRVASYWNIPVMTTPGGKGCFRTDDALSLGGSGLGGSPQADLWVKRGIDLMIVIGSRLSDLAMSGITPDFYPKKVIQFDCDPTFIGKAIPVPTIAVIGDAKHNLCQLLKYAQGKQSPVPVGRDVLQEAQKEIAATVNFVKQEPNHEPSILSAAATMRVLRRNVPRDTIFFGDNGSHTFYAIQHLDIYEPGTFYFDEYFATMGHAIGYSIGAKLARPERPIVCITGDGCMMMHGTEVSTAVCNNIPVIFVVLNNGRLAMVDVGMKKMFNFTVGSVFETPMNATAFAQSLGAAAFRCSDENDVARALQFAINHQGPTVVEVLVDPEEIPPILKR